MPVMEGFKQLSAFLQKRAEKSRKEDDVTVMVGYQAEYAIFRA